MREPKNDIQPTEQTEVTNKLLLSIPLSSKFWMRPVRRDKENQYMLIQGQLIGKIKRCKGLCTKSWALQFIQTLKTNKSKHRSQHNNHRTFYTALLQ